MHGKVSIVMINWNGLEFLENCIPSVLAQTCTAVEFFVIDNASQDRSVDWLKSHHPEVRVLLQDRNLGFAKAHNLGIRQSSGEYYMPLNFDVILEPTYVGELVAAMESDARVGSVTGKLLRMSECGTPSSIIDSTGHVLRVTRVVEDRGRGEYDERQYDDQIDVFGVSGAAPLYRRSMLESIRIGDEYFDEQYFAYWEDVDLAWRANRAGWRARFVPTAVAHHFRQGSERKSRRIEKAAYRNRYLTLVKNDRVLDVLRDFRYLLLFEFHQWYRMVFHRRRWHLWRAVPGLLAALPAALRKRGSILGGASRRVAMRFPPPRRRQCQRYRRKLWRSLFWFALGTSALVFALTR